MKTAVILICSSQFLKTFEEFLTGRYTHLFMSFAEELSLKMKFPLFEWDALWSEGTCFILLSSESTVKTILYPTLFFLFQN